VERLDQLGRLGQYNRHTRGLSQTWPSNIPDRGTNASGKRSFNSSDGRKGRVKGEQPITPRGSRSSPEINVPALPFVYRILARITRKDIKPDSETVEILNETKETLIRSATLEDMMMGLDSYSTRKTR